MYTGTIIDDLIKTVQRAEADATATDRQKQPAMVELQMFMAQMQHMHHARRIQVGVA